MGDGTTCTPSPCPAEGACCVADGSCYVTPVTGCTHLSGVYKGNDTTCNAAGCPQPTRGACCFRDGACSLLVQSDCGNALGTYGGNASVCSPNPCSQPGTQGACCNAQGSCQVTTQTACNTAHGLFLGTGSTCSPDPCPTLGDSFLGIWRLEMQLKICGTDSVMYQATIVDTVCTLDESTNPGTLECNYTNDGGSLVSTCINTFESGTCTITMTSTSRLTYGTGTYTVTGRSIETTSGTDCPYESNCYDTTVQATRTGPPPTPCPEASLDDVLVTLTRHAARAVLRR
jgi:hypothetical protein